MGAMESASPEGTYHIAPARRQLQGSIWSSTLAIAPIQEVTQRAQLLQISLRTLWMNKMLPVEYNGVPGAALSLDDIDQMVAGHRDNGQFVALLEGIKRFGIMLQLVLPDDNPQPIVKPPPRSVVFIDDGDFTRAVLGVAAGGPGGFDAPSLDAVIRNAAIVVVNGTDPVKATGALAVLAADALGLALLIDTDGGQFPLWAERVASVRGAAGVILAGDPATLPIELRAKTMTVGKIV